MVDEVVGLVVALIGRLVESAHGLPSILLHADAEAEASLVHVGEYGLRREMLLLGGRPKPVDGLSLILLVIQRKRVRQPQAILVLRGFRIGTGKSAPTLGKADGPSTATICPRSGSAGKPLGHGMSPVTAACGE